MIAIVMIGYNRVDSLKRLYNSVCKASINECATVDLIFSLDYYPDRSVFDFANNAVWEHGKKIIRTFVERQGLRKHILSCADFFEMYEALIILEDDVCVATDFYNYAVQAIEFYKNNSDIAGISLYSHSLYQANMQWFFPMRSIYDIYFVQYAASWGQIWIKKQFLEFLEWYNHLDNKTFLELDIPDYVKEWPDTSWLKYHIGYCVAQGKYFVYPYNSLSTNYADPGQHFPVSSDAYQVELQKGADKAYYFPNLNDSDVVRYDSFFENQQLYNCFLELTNLCLDINGFRSSYPEGCRYCLSTKKLNKKVMKTFGLRLRPIEENVIENVEGQGIYLYDLNYDERNKNRRVQENMLWIYNCKGRNLPPKLLAFIWQKILMKLKK